MAGGRQVVQCSSGNAGAGRWHLRQDGESGRPHSPRGRCNRTPQVE